MRRPSSPATSPSFVSLAAQMCAISISSIRRASQTPSCKRSQTRNGRLALRLLHGENCTIELIGLLRSGAYQMDVSAISHDIAAAGLAAATK